MYKSILGLVFKCNGGGRQFNSIQFNSQKNIAIKEMREKKRKDQTRTQDVTEFGLQYLLLRGSQPLTIEVNLKH
jgi:hypothetical protein